MITWDKMRPNTLKLFILWQSHSADPGSIDPEAEMSFAISLHQNTSEHSSSPSVRSMGSVEVLTGASHCLASGPQEEPLKPCAMILSTLSRSPAIQKPHQQLSRLIKVSYDTWLQSTILLQLMGINAHPGHDKGIAKSATDHFPSSIPHLTLFGCATCLCL